MDYEALYKLESELAQYAYIEGSEIGEVCLSLIQTSKNIDYVSDEFSKALLKEMQEQLNYFKTHSNIRKEMQEYNVLEWKS